MFRLRGWLWICLVIGTAAPAVLAEAPEGKGSPAAMQRGGDTEKAADEAAAPGDAWSSLAIVGSCLAAAICVIGGGWAIARVGSACIEAIARQPEAAGSMFAPMIVAAAMIEGGMLFAIVVCLVGMTR